VLLGGCGSTRSGTQSSTATQLCPGGQKACISTVAKAKGPADITTGITREMAINQRQLKNVTASCPHQPSPPHYPVVCHFRAIDLGEKLTRAQLKQPLGRILAGRHRVAGTITISGVYTRTMTYVYQLNYALSR
jgi:hypothetical protein